MNSSDLRRLQRIIATGNQLLGYISEKGITKEVISQDVTVQWTVTTPLYNIGEHTYRLSKELRESHPNIPWGKVAGLRHRLVHNYDDTNWSIINIIIFEDLPAFLKQVEAIVSAQNKTE